MNNLQFHVKHEAWSLNEVSSFTLVSVFFFSEPANSNSKLHGANAIKEL